jgi:hypothetical protein
MPLLRAAATGEPLGLPSACGWDGSPRADTARCRVAQDAVAADPAPLAQPAPSGALRGRACCSKAGSTGRHPGEHYARAGHTVAQGAERRAGRRAAGEAQPAPLQAALTPALPAWDASLPLCWRRRCSRGRRRCSRALTPAWSRPQDKKCRAAEALSRHRRSWLEQCKRQGPAQEQVQQLTQQFEDSCEALLQGLG